MTWAVFIWFVFSGTLSNLILWIDHSLLWTPTSTTFSSRDEPGIPSNNSLYDIRLRLQYTDFLGNTIYSPYEYSSGTPLLSGPNAPTNEVATSVSATALQVAWAVDSSSNPATQYTVYKNNEILFNA